MDKKKKQVLYRVLAFLGLAAVLILCIVKSNSNEGDTDTITYVIENEKVKVVEYKGVEIEEEDPIEVNDAYLEQKFENVVEFYNSYAGTEYEGTDDETVSAVTGGTYSTYEEWADKVRAGYEEGEAEDAVANMAQNIWMIVLANSELVRYTQEEYDSEYESVQDGLFSYTETTTVEEYMEAEDLTEEEFQEVMNTTTLYFLKYRYVLDAIGEAEGLEPTEEEIMDEYIYEHMNNTAWEEGSEEWNEEYEILMESYEDYYYTELYNRVQDFLYDNAKIIS